MQVRLARLRAVYERALKRGKLELAGNLASELLDAESNVTPEQPANSEQEADGKNEEPKSK